MVLVIETYGKQNVDIDMVKSLVDFVLSVNNVNLLSWGTHTVKYNGNFVSIPAIIRWFSLEHIWRSYYEHNLNTEFETIG